MCHMPTYRKDVSFYTMLQHGAQTVLRPVTCTGRLLDERLGHNQCHEMLGCLLQGRPLLLGQSKPFLQDVCRAAVPCKVHRQRLPESGWAHAIQRPLGITILIIKRSLAHLAREVLEPLQVCSCGC
jgi:hypothetical protein